MRTARCVMQRAVLSLGHRSGERGIFFSNAQNGYTPLIRIGDASETLDGKFSKLGDPDLSENGALAFTAAHKGRNVKGLNAKMLCWRLPGATLFDTLIGGTATVGDLPGAKWKSFDSFTLLKATVGNLGMTRSFNNNAQVVWLANFTDKSRAIIVTEVP